MPVELLRAGNVLHTEQKHVFVALEQTQRWVIEMRRQPVGADEALRMRVAFGGHERIGGVGQG